MKRLLAILAITALTACSTTSFVSREEKAWSNYQKRHELKQGDPLSADDWDALVRVARLYSGEKTPTTAEIQRRAEWIALYHRWGTFRDRLEKVDTQVTNDDRLYLAELGAAISSRLTVAPGATRLPSEPIRRAAKTETTSDDSVTRLLD